MTGQNRSVGELLDTQVGRGAQRTAVTFEGETLSYGELDERVRRVQTWLADSGVGKGDNVALLMRNSLEFLYAWLGIARTGAVAVPINAASVGDGLHYTLDHSESVGLIADADLLDRLAGMEPLPTLRWKVARGSSADAAAGVVTMAELLDAVPASSAPDIDRLDPMTIIYTSGTTGLPKGVVLSHASYLNTGRYFSRHFSLGPDDVLQTCLPLFHCNAQQTTVMSAFVQGASVALHGRFSLSRFWTWIEESGATVTNLLGSMLALLAKVPPKPTDAANSLRYIAAAPVPAALHRPLEERFGVRIVEGYGLTETGTMACINPVNDTRSGTIGCPLDHNELRVVDENDVDVPDGTPGEIITRSGIPGAYMTGYFKEPDKTAQAMRDGWFHTGDVGLRREDGYYVFVDRLKDTIRRRGENISSFLVERVLTAHPDIMEAAAIGVPSELSEEDVKVIVIVRPGATMTAQDVIEWSAQKMSDFMVPRYVEFRGDLPRTETGRVHKYLLRREGVGAAWDAQALTGEAR
jgi:crotonobetaine/carnitine-CoA ligase